MADVPVNALETIRARVARRRRRLWVHGLLSAALAVVAVACLLPLAAVVLDHLTPRGLPAPIISGAGVAWTVALPLAIVAVVVLAARRRLAAAYVAREIEHDLHISHNPVLNSLLLAERGDAPHALEGVARQALRAVGDAPVSGPAAPLYRRSLWLLLLVAGLWIGYAAVASKALWPSIQRFFGAAVAAPSATVIERVRPAADARVYAAEPLELEFEIRGAAADELRFQRLSADGEPLAEYVIPRSTAAIGPDRRALSLAATEVQGDVHYRCEAGDGVLVGVVPVRPQPRLEGVRLRVSPPAYSGQALFESATSPVVVLQGSNIEVLATANVEASDPVLAIGGAGSGRVRMRLDAARRVASASFLALESCELRVLFTDEVGRPGGAAAVALEVRQDAPPTIEIVQPRREDAPNDEVDLLHVPFIRLRAGDDVGLDRVVLHTEDGIVREASPLALPAAYPISAEIAIPTSDFQLPVGRKIRVRFEAVDRRALPDGASSPQSATTRTLTLTRSAPPPPEPADPAAQAAGDAGADQAGGDGEGATARARGGRSSASGEDGTPGGEPGSSQGQRVARPGQRGDDSPAGGAPSQAAEGDASGAAAGDAGDSGAEGGSGEISGSVTSGAGDDRDAESMAEEIAEEHAEDIADARRVLESAGGGESGAGEGGTASDPTESSGDAGPSNSNPPPRPESPVPQSAPAGEGERSEEPREGAGAESASESAEEGEPPASDDNASEDGAAEGEPEQPGESAGSGESETETGEQGAEPGSQDPSAETGSEPSPASQPASEREGGPEGETPSPSSAPSDAAGQEPAAGEGEAPPDEPGTPAGAESGGETPTETPAEGSEAGAGDATPPTTETSEGEKSEDGDPPSNPASDGANDARGARDPSGAAGGPAAPGADPGAEPGSPAEDAPADETQAADGTKTEELLRLLEAMEKLSPEELAALGWTDTRRRAFVRRLEGLREIARAAGLVTEQQRVAVDYRPGEDQATEGGGGAGGQFGGESYVDRVRAIQPPRSQSIDPRLQRILDEYYRSLGAKSPATQPAGE